MEDLLRLLISEGDQRPSGILVSSYFERGREGVLFFFEHHGITRLGSDLVGVSPSLKNLSRYKHRDLSIKTYSSDAIYFRLEDSRRMCALVENINSEHRDIDPLKRKDRIERLPCGFKELEAIVTPYGRRVLVSKTAFPSSVHFLPIYTRGHKTFAAHFEINDEPSVTRHLRQLLGRLGLKDSGNEDYPSKVVKSIYSRLGSKHFSERRVPVYT